MIDYIGLRTPGFNNMLQYPLMFGRGEDWYHFRLKLSDPNTGRETYKKVSALVLFVQRLMVRKVEYNHLSYFKQQLNQQHIVDTYAKIEIERFVFMQTKPN